MSSNSAKRLLQEFVEKHGSDLEVVYTLSGWFKSCPPSYNIRLVSGSKLAEAKQEFDGNCSFQVYSVQACIPKDPAALWNTEFVQAEELFKQPFVVDNCLRDNRFCGISNAFVKRNVEGTPVSNGSVQHKNAGISTLSKTSSAHQNNTVPPPQQNKIQQSSPKVGLLSSNVVKDVKGESKCVEVHDQAAKSAADKDKVQPLAVSKKNKSSPGNEGSLANLWGRTSAKPKPDCAPADASAEAQICAHEAEENGNSEDDAEVVNFRRVSNCEGNRKRKVVFDLSDEDECEEAVNLASPDLLKGQECPNPEQSKKILAAEKPKVKEDKPKVKEEKAIGEESNQSLGEDSSAVRERMNTEASFSEKIQNGAPKIDVNKDKMADSVPNSPKRRKVLKTQIDERGREVTEVVWDGNECETKNVASEAMKKADSTRKLRPMQSPIIKEMEMSKDDAMSFEDGAKKEPKTIKRSLSTMADEDDLQIAEKQYREVVYSLTKPSYILRRRAGSKNLRRENRYRLCYFLCKLVRQRNWVDASGVLSMLLKGTSKAKCLMVNRLKYTISMELLNHLESGSINSMRIRNVYDIWMKRIGSTKDSRLEEKVAVHLEFIIFCLTRGDVNEAHQATLSLMQEREFGRHPMSNMVVALTFYERWHSSIPKEMQWKDSDQIDSPMRSDLSGVRLSHRGGKLDVFDSVYSHKDETCFIDDSNTSVMIGKKVSMDIDNDLSKDDTMEDRVHLQRESDAQNSQPLNSIENEVSFFNDDGPVNLASLIVALESFASWLLPIQLPKAYEDYEDFMQEHGKLLNDDYKNAMMYLRLALHSTPPVLSALLPYVQLLLIGGHIEEALKELDKFNSNSPTDIHVRLRARLLECLNRNNYGMLSTCFEDILKKDPTCCDSLAKLISMHQIGNYSTESLLEMIALHLDATYADYNTWREFGLCFLKLSQCEEDRMSVCLGGNKGVKTLSQCEEDRMSVCLGGNKGVKTRSAKKQRFSFCYNRIPNILIEGKSGKNWMLRCRWWLNRHFSKNKLASDIAAGDLQLTYKAACATHMYGQKFDYVVKASESLNEKKDRDLFMFLQKYKQNFIGLYSDNLHTKK